MSSADDGVWSSVGSLAHVERGAPDRTDVSWLMTTTAWSKSLFVRYGVENEKNATASGSRWLLSRRSEKLVSHPMCWEAGFSDANRPKKQQASLRESPASLRASPAPLPESPASRSGRPRLPLRESPASLRVFPASLRESPASLRVFPASLRASPASLRASPASLRVFPASLRESPASLRASPASLRVLPAFLRVFPAALRVFPASLPVFPVSGRRRGRRPCRLRASRSSRRSRGPGESPKATRRPCAGLRAASRRSPRASRIDTARGSTRIPRAR